MRLPFKRSRPPYHPQVVLEKSKEAIDQLTGRSPKKSRRFLLGLTLVTAIALVVLAVFKAGDE